MSVMHVRVCDARVAETPPSSNHRPLTGKEPGMKCILVELASNKATGLWPPSESGLRSPYTVGLAFTKIQAAELAAKLKELSDSMDGQYG